MYFTYIRPILDIGFLSFIMYKAYSVIVKTHGVQLIKGAIVLIISYALALLLDLTLLLWLLNILAPGMLIAVAIVFQPELRKIFMKIAQGDWFSLGSRAKHLHIDSVLSAAEQLSSQKRGMLAVFVRSAGMKDIADTGTRLNADLSSNLLITIFSYDTPMHDGAAIIQGGKVLSAGCFLPLSEQYDIKKTFGTRHRAALGLSEVTDAVVLVVSEETGALSLAYDSKLYYDLSVEQVQSALVKQLDLSTDIEKEEESYDDETIN